MKISSNQYYEVLTKQLAKQQESIGELQTQLATGKKTAVPSSDIESSLEGLSIKSVLQRQSAYETNLSYVKDRLTIEESVVTGFQDYVYRLKDLAITASSGTYSDEDIGFMKAEAEGVLEELISLSNSRDSQNSYLFSGTATNVQPFQRQADGSIAYKGNSAELNIQVDSGYEVQINSSGVNLAGQIERSTNGGSTQNLDIFAVAKDFIAALGTNTKADISRSIDEFDELGNQVGGQIANLGIRQNLLEERLEIIEEKKTVYEQLLSNIEDTDYSEAITSLSSDMLALEAAQNTFAKVTQMSLFNFLR
ncbi:MAG: flagellar hook-associated protein FlgL [Gammaproteobacteria bacterium]|jgi:flagellar hook-associated protein 3 FlgL|nr:flagellar hook-associated protein FlgL [Gammaproteobacteria bacterium]